MAVVPRRGANKFHLFLAAPGALTAANAVEHTVAKDGRETKYAVTLPMAVTDIRVNAALLTLDCDFTVSVPPEYVQLK